MMSVHSITTLHHNTCILVCTYHNQALHAQTPTTAYLIAAKSWALMLLDWREEEKKKKHTQKIPVQPPVPKAARIPPSPHLAARRRLTPFPAILSLPVPSIVDIVLFYPASFFFFLWSFGLRVFSAKIPASSLRILDPPSWVQAILWQLAGSKLNARLMRRNCILHMAYEYRTDLHQSRV